jgi:hypothetical protein
MPQRRAENSKKLAVIYDSPLRKNWCWRLIPVLQEPSVIGTENARHPLRFFDSK